LGGKGGGKYGGGDERGLISKLSDVSVTNKNRYGLTPSFGKFYHKLRRSAKKTQREGVNELPKRSTSQRGKWP